MHAFSAIKMKVWFKSRFTDLSTVHVQIVQLYTEKSQTLKMIETHFIVCSS